MSTTALDVGRLVVSLFSSSSSPDRPSAKIRVVLGTVYFILGTVYFGGHRRDVLQHAGAACNGFRYFVCLTAPSAVLGSAEFVGTFLTVLKYNGTAFGGVPGTANFAGTLLPVLKYDGTALGGSRCCPTYRNISAEMQYSGTTPVIAWFHNATHGRIVKLSCLAVK